MGKTREHESPGKQGPLNPVQGNGKILPLTPSAQERLEVGKRMGEKREAEQKEMFPAGIPERSQMPGQKDVAQELGAKAKPIDGELGQALQKTKPDVSKAPKMVIAGGKVKSKGVSKKSQEAVKAKGQPSKSDKTPAKQDAKGVTPEEHPDLKAAEGPQDAPSDEEMMTKPIAGQEDPVHEPQQEGDEEKKEEEKIGDGNPESETPDPKSQQEGAQPLGQEPADTAKPQGKAGALPAAETRVAAAKPGGKGAAPKGKIKGEKIEGEEAPDKMAADHGKAADTATDGEEGGDEEKEEGAGKEGKGKEGETKTAPLVRGNFGEGQEPRLLQVNQEALKEFGPEAILTRNEDGTTIVVAGNFSATSDDGPSKDGKPKPMRKDVNQAVATQMYAPNRLKCQGYLDAFEGEARGMVTSLQGARGAIAGQITAGAEAAKADVLASSAKESATIKKQFESKKAALRNTAKHQKAAVRASEKAAKSAVESVADKATADVQKSYDDNLANMDALEKFYSAGFKGQFTKAPKDLEKACAEVCTEAQTQGDKRTAAFKQEKVPEQSTWQDVKWGGSFSRDKYNARIKASQDTTASYIDSFKNSTKEASDALGTSGLPEMLTFVTTSVATAKGLLKTAYDKSIADIAAKKKSTLDDIATNANTSCDAIDGTLKVGLGSLYAKQKQAIKQLEFNAQANIDGIDKTALEKKEELELQSQAAIDAISEHIDATVTEVSAQNNPDAEQINGQLLGILEELRSGYNEAMNLATQGPEGVVAAINTSAKDVIKAFQEVRDATLAEGDRIKEGNVFTITKQAKDYAKKAKEIETPATKALKGLGTKGVQDLEAEYRKVYNDVKLKYDQLEKLFVDNTAGFKGNLQEALKGKGTADCKGLDKEITENAKKAADAIKPRWKRWAMALVSIIVMIVITAVICAMLIPPACGILAVLAAGAAMGAVGGAVKYGAAVLIMDEEVSLKKFGHYVVEGTVDGVMIAATMVPGLKVPLVLAMGAGGGMIKYGNDIVLGDGQTKFSWGGLLTAAGAGTLDAAINLAGARYAGKVDKAIEALGGPAMLTIKDKFKVFVQKDVTQALGATFSGFVQNTQKNFAQGKDFDMNSLDPMHLLEEFGTNLLNNKVAEKSVAHIVGKTSKSQAHEKSMSEAKATGEPVIGSGNDIKAFAEKTLAESNATQKPSTEVKPTTETKVEPTTTVTPENSGTTKKVEPTVHEDANATTPVVEPVASKKKAKPNEAETKGNKQEADAVARKQEADALAAKQQAEAKAKQEAEAKAKQEAESKAKQEAEAKANQEAEAKAKQEAEAKAKQEAENKAKQEAEAKAREEAEAKAKAEKEAKQKEIEEQAKKDAEELAKKEEASKTNEAPVEQGKVQEGKANPETKPLDVPTDANPTTDHVQSEAAKNANEAGTSRKVAGRGRLHGQRLKAKEIARITESLQKKFGCELHVIPEGGAQDIPGFTMGDGSPAKMPKKAAAVFITDGNKKALVVREGATAYEVFHEMMHLRHSEMLGLKNYHQMDKVEAHPELVKEQFVFDKIIEHQEMFTKEELTHAQDYINDVRHKYGQNPVNFNFDNAPTVRPLIKPSSILQKN